MMLSIIYMTSIQNTLLHWIMTMSSYTKNELLFVDLVVDIKSWGYFQQSTEAGC